MKNYSRDGNTWSPVLPAEKSVCRSRRNRTGHGTTDWFQSGKEYLKAINCHPAYLYAEYIRNAGLDEAQSEIKVAKRNINNLRYTVDTTLMVKSEEELKSLLMKMKEEKSEKIDLNSTFRK